MNEFSEYNCLCHYGVLGMKWGVRRFQNKDGSLTSEGRLRYGGEKAEKYRAKLLAKAQKKNLKKGILLSSDKNGYIKATGKYDKAIKKIESMSNEEMAQKLAEKKKKGMISATAGVVSGAVAATLTTLMGRKVLDSLQTVVTDEMGFDLPEGLKFKQDPKEIVKTYATRTTLTAAQAYVFSQLRYDRKLIDQINK